MLVVEMSRRGGHLWIFLATPLSPIVLRHLVTLRILAPANIRSLLLMILAMAAAISGMMAHCTRFSSAA